MEAEQPLFAPGDRVVCINATGQKGTLKEGIEYTITGVMRVNCCKRIVVSVGISGDFENHQCVQCGRRRPYTGENHYSQMRFVPIQDNEAMEEEIFNSLKGHTILNDK